MILNLICSILIYFCLFIGILICLEILVFYFRQEYKTAKIFPGPKFYPLIGNIYEVLFRSPEMVFTMLRENALKYKASYAYYFLGYLAINIIRSKDIEPILSDLVSTKKNITYDFIRPFLGSGLLTSEGKKWLQRRKILTPAFHFNILQQFHSIFINETDLIVENLKQTVNNPDGIVLQDLISTFTLNTVCETAMGVKLNTLEEPDEYRKTIHEIGKCMVYRLMRPWLHFRIFYLMSWNRLVFLNYIKKAHSFTRNVINQRKELFRSGKITTEFDYDENIYETKKSRHAMLDTLLASELKGEIVNEGIAEEVDTFMFEGHDTTSAGLMGILLLLAHHPEAQERIFEEIQQERDQNNGDNFTSNQYGNMKYFDRVIKECFRIYPPVPYIGREITKHSTINNHKFPVGTILNIHIFDIHRDPEEFPDPERFDPDRFLPENCEKRSAFSYIPFSAGTRNCIGQKFSMLLIKTLLTKIISNFNILPVTRREDVIFLADLVLRSQSPIKVKFQLRNI